MNPTHTLVHLTYQGTHTNLVACIGEGSQYKVMGATLSHPGYQLTGEPSAVTCPACRKTRVFQETQARFPK